MTLQTPIRDTAVSGRFAERNEILGLITKALREGENVPDESTPEFKEFMHGYRSALRHAMELIFENQDPCTEDLFKSEAAPFVQ